MIDLLKIISKLICLPSGSKSAFKFEYDLLIPIKGRNIKISFDDWIFKQDEVIAINRATLKKFGFKVGELTVVFQKN